MNTVTDFAILAPIPLEHLESGKIVCEREGKVVFGSNAWEVFRRIDNLRSEFLVDVFIYASHGQSVNKATWKAKYIGHIESFDGSHSDGMKFRPPTTSKYKNDNSGFWAVFWEVTKLRELPNEEQVSLFDFSGFEKEKKYKKGFIPEGPIIVEHP